MKHPCNAKIVATLGPVSTDRVTIGSFARSRGAVISQCPGHVGCGFKARLREASGRKSSTTAM
jgi:hypothetical protein